MKRLMTSLALGSIALLLTACNDEGGSQPAAIAPPIFVISSNFNPTVRPANEASPDYTAQILNIISRQGVDQATDAVIFGKSRGSFEKAYNRLSVMGKRSLAEIQNNCEIIDNQKSEAGTLDLGTRQTISLFSSAKGNYCPISLNKSQYQNNTLVKNTAEEYVVTSDVSATVDYQQLTSRRNSGDVAAFKSTINGRSTTSVVRSPGADLKKVKNQSSGQVSITLRNGEVLTGPLYIETLEVSQGDRRKSIIQDQEQYLVELSTPRGMVRIVYIKDIASSETRKAYVNGSVVNPYLLADFFGDDEIYGRARQY